MGVSLSSAATWARTMGTSDSGSRGVRMTKLSRTAPACVTGRKKPAGFLLPMP